MRNWKWISLISNFKSAIGFIRWFFEKDACALFAELMLYFQSLFALFDGGKVCGLIRRLSLCLAVIIFFPEGDAFASVPKIKIRMQNSVISKASLLMNSKEISSVKGVQRSRGESRVSSKKKVPTLSGSSNSRQAQSLRKKMKFGSRSVKELPHLRRVNEALSTNEEIRRNLIAEVELEDYLSGVISAEMPASWPLEALKAQAVLARTYALKRWQDRQGDSFHLESTTADQVYRPEGFHRLSYRFRQKVLRALKETEGLVLKNPNGELAQIYYHSACGGQLSTAASVWGGSVEYRIAQKDPTCSRSERQAWKFRIPKNQLGQILRRRGFRVSQLRVLRRDFSGRAQSLEVSLQRVQEEEKLNDEQALDHLAFQISGEELRKKLGYNHLKSTQFQIETDGQNYTFKGRGHGHGVGFCQHGAKERALQGQPYQKILSFYYPKLRPSPLSYILSKNTPKGSNPN